MVDPVSGGGADGVRFAISTVPALIATPLALAMAAGVLAGAAGAGVTTGFSIAIVLAMAVEYLRRGSLSARGAGMRRGLLAAMSAIYRMTAAASLAALALAILAASRCAPPACAETDHVVAVVAIVFAAIAVAAGAALVLFLRSPAWRRHRDAVAGG